jgi:hypothetical protein
MFLECNEQSCFASISSSISHRYTSFPDELQDFLAAQRFSMQRLSSHLRKQWHRFYKTQ